VPLLTVALALLAPRAAAAAVPAHQQITNYVGAQSCTVCHTTPRAR
jgi:mono/diheme cytochrome c family protein